MLAVKLIVPACMPAAVGLPRNHSAEPVNAGLAVIIGIHADLAPLAVMTRPCAAPGSALMTWMVTRAPAWTWLPSAVAWPGLTRGPGAFAQSRPMILPGSRMVPIMKPGRAWPRIHAGAARPPIIQR